MKLIHNANNTHWVNAVGGSDKIKFVSESIERTSDLIAYAELRTGKRSRAADGSGCPKWRELSSQSWR